MRTLRWTLLLALLSCGGSTGGTLVQVPFRAGGVVRDPSKPFTFDTPTGWTVTLTTARIATGPFYFNIIPAPTSTFRAGVVILEATAQVIVDPLDPTLHELAGGADGETGKAVSVEIGLLPPDVTASSAASDLLGNGFAYVAGTATKDATSVPFAGLAIVDQSLATSTQPLAALQRIAGAAVDLQVTGGAQNLTMRIDPTHWFDQTDFGSLAATPVIQGAHGWAEKSTFHAQLLQGIKSSSGVYAFTLE